jgi:hypothetical protein
MHKTARGASLISIAGCGVGDAYRNCIPRTSSEHRVRPRATSLMHEGID